MCRRTRSTNPIMLNAIIIAQLNQAGSQGGRIMLSAKLLANYGFQGALSTGALQRAVTCRRHGRLPKQIRNKVPAKPGVYAVVTPPGYVFRLKEKMDEGKLHLESDSQTLARRVFDTDIIYIGETKRTLPIRIRELILHGLGKVSNHRGGQDIWLLEGNDSFRLYWKASDNPPKLKESLLEKFKEQHHGNRPFGNKMG